MSNILSKNIQVNKPYNYLFSITGQIQLFSDRIQGQKFCCYLTLCCFLRFCWCCRLLWFCWCCRFLWFCCRLLRFCWCCWCCCLFRLSRCWRLRFNRWLLIKKVLYYRFIFVEEIICWVLTFKNECRTYTDFQLRLVLLGLLLRRFLLGLLLGRLLLGFLLRLWLWFVWFWGFCCRFVWFWCVFDCFFFGFSLLWNFRCNFFSTH